MVVILRGHLMMMMIFNGSGVKERVDMRTARVGQGVTKPLLGYINAAFFNFSCYYLFIYFRHWSFKGESVVVVGGDLFLFWVKCGHCNAVTPVTEL